MRARTLIVGTMWALGASVSADLVTTQRQHELIDLVHRDCGACHGMRLAGGLGPALTRDALAGKSAGLLTATISEGRTGTPMPPWKTLLTEAEITWIVDYLKSREADR